MKNAKIYQDFLKSKEFIKQKNIEEAYIRLKKLMKKDSENYAIRLEFAKVLIDMNNLSRARRILESLIDSKNKNYAILELGKLSVIEGDFYKAREYFESLLNTTNITYGLLELGKLEILEGNYIQAQTCFYKILSIKNDENKSCAIQEILNLNIKLGHYEEALVYLEKLINTDKSLDIREVEKYKFYLEYNLKEINNKRKINGYFNNQLVEYSEVKAINYIGFNSNENKNVIHNIFNNDVEIKSLFNRMKDEIKQLEPVNFGIYDKYTIELENVIGSVRNIDTNLLCIVTICGTKNIISMFPVLNKNRLNNKKIIKSKELSLK